MDLDQPIVCATSWGNDSCALVQFLHERGQRNVTTLYNDTGWAAIWWPARVERMEAWARSLGFKTARTISIGMEQLVVDHRGWPRQGMQFCTEDLKIVPTQHWLDEHDPERHALVCVGVRREESEARRDVQEFEIEDPRAGGRHQWRPLFMVKNDERDELLRRAGIKPLPHRSKECDPCINSNRNDIRELEEPTIAKVERIETRLGFSHGGKPRVMYRPAKRMGATGIREVVQWAKSERGKYRRGVNIDDEPAGDCGDIGYCGS